MRAKIAHDSKRLSESANWLMEGNTQAYAQGAFGIP